MSRKKSSAALPGGYTPPDMLVPMKKEERILLAFSGGADSSALLDMLLRSGFTVECAHLDHMIRGAEAERDREFCAEVCRERGVPIHTECVDVPASARERGEGLEEAARRERYAFFERVMTARGIRLLATAHNADDNLETMLMRLTRGCGARGMCGIPPVRGLGGGRTVVRPILGVTKAEIHSYCRERGIRFVYDSTNDDVDYSRNRLRARVLPELRRINPAADAAAARLAANLRADCAYLDALAGKFIKENLHDGSLPTAKLAEEASPVSSRVVRLLAADAGCGMPEETHISAVLAALGAHGRKRISLPGGVDAVLADGRLSFARSGTDDGSRVLPDGIYPLREGGNPLPGGFSVTLGDTGTPGGENINIIYKVSTKTHLSADKIKGALYARPRRAGDRILLGGMHKSLKKLFCDKKIPSCLRAAIPVICDGEDVIYVPFIGVRDGAEAKYAGSAVSVTVRLDGGPETYGYPEDDTK